jgi:hypothetical protein
MSFIPGDSYTVSIETIIYGSYVKYDRLQQQVYNTFSNTSIASATELNIFIDLYSVLKSIFSENYRTDISDYTAITSGVINMCSHYRAFFKRLSVHTKFYIVFSFNTCDINRKFVSGYNQSFYNKSQIKMFNDVAMNNFSLLELLCPYLPDIFFVRSPRNFESSILIANLIEQINDGNPNLIISRDIYPLQLCSLYPYTSYLYPKKVRGLDESVMIPISEKQSFSYEFWNLVASIRRIKLESIGDISPINYSLFSALHRFPERNIDQLTDLNNVRYIINKIVGNSNIKVHPQQLYEDYEISSKIQVALAESRLKALDIEYILPFYKNDPESKSIKLENLSDDRAINTINAKFLSHNPIDLSKL